MSTLTVTNLNDHGSGSLRDTIAAAAPGDAIRFSPKLNKGTIGLTSGQLVISNDLTIQGPSDGKLAVNGGGSGRVFLITSGSVSISGLTIAGGSVTAPDVGLPFAAGGGVLNVGGNVTLADDTMTGDSVSNALGGALGGGLANVGDAATMVIRDSAIDGDSAVGGFGEGAGVANLLGATMTVTDGAVSNNQTIGYIVGIGGGLANDAGSAITVNGTLFSGNTVTAILGAGPLSPLQGFAAGGGLANLSGSSGQHQGLHILGKSGFRR